MLMMSTVPPGKIKSTNFKSTSIPEIHTSNLPQKLPGTDGLPFLDTLINPLLTLLNPQSTENSPTQIGSWTTTLTIPFQQNYLLSTPSSTELNKYVLWLNSLQGKWNHLHKVHKTTTTKHSSFKKANPNRKPTKSQTHPQESL